MSDDPMPSWLQRFHDTAHGRFDQLNGNLHDLRQAMAAGFNRLIQEIHMSQSTLSQQMDVANAALAAGLDKIQTDVTAIAAELAAAVPPAGTTMTQAQVDSLNASVARLQAVQTSLDGLVVPPAQNPAP